MSSDAFRKRELRSAYSVQVLVRILKNSGLGILGLCFIAVMYLEMSRTFETEEVVQEMRRFDNSPQGKLIDDFRFEQNSNESNPDCQGPCLPDFDSDKILNHEMQMEKLIQDVLPILTPYGKEVLTYDITGLKIYVYDLPSRFNYDLIQCAKQNKANSMCFDFSNSGFGSEMNVKSSLPKFQKFYKTHQFSLEVIIHEKLLKSPYLTSDPNEAHLFYVPYFVGLSCFCGPDTARNRSREFWASTGNFEFIDSGKVHFMALGKVEQEMSSERCPFLQHTNTSLFKYLVIERTLSDSARRFFHRAGKEDETLVVPYPSYGHFHMPYVEIPGVVNRTIKAMFAGSMKNSQLRKILSAQLEECDTGKYYHMSPDECSTHRQDIGRRVVALMMKSIFCLHPPGDTPTRKSFFDSIMAGCIPVIFNRQVRYPFDELFNYQEFSIFVDEDAITKNNVHIIEDVLEKIPFADVIRIQGNVASVARFLQYGYYGYGDDAVSTVLRLLLHVSS